MNSKESLNAILDILNYEQIDECDKKDLLRIIKQDLDRLEQLEKEKQEVETRLSSKETNTFDEIATMIKKANGYDVLVNKCKQLEKENQELKEILNKTRKMGLETIEEKEQLSNELHKLNCYRNIELNENTKLKKTFEILKDKIEFEDLGEMQSGNMYRGYFIDCLDEEEYELLKEVFESE